MRSGRSFGRLWLSQTTVWSAVRAELMLITYVQSDKKEWKKVFVEIQINQFISWDSHYYQQNEWISKLFINYKKYDGIIGFIALFFSIAWTISRFMATRVSWSSFDFLSVKNSSRTTITTMKRVCKMRWQLCSEAWSHSMCLQRLFIMYKGHWQI